MRICEALLLTPLSPHTRKLITSIKARVSGEFHLLIIFFLLFINLLKNDNSKVLQRQFLKNKLIRKGNRLNNKLVKQLFLM